MSRGSMSSRGAGQGSRGVLNVGGSTEGNLQLGALMVAGGATGAQMGRAGSADEEAQRAKMAFLCPALEGGPVGVMNVEWTDFFHSAGPVLRHLPWLRWVARGVSGAAAEIGLVSLPGSGAGDRDGGGMMPSPAMPGCMESQTMQLASDLIGSVKPPPHEAAAFFAPPDPFESQLPPVLAAASGLRMCYGIVGASVSATGLSTAPPTHLVASIGSIAGEALAWTQDSAIDAAIRASSSVASQDPSRGVPTVLDLAREM